MELLAEFFDPVPLYALAAVLFALIAFFVISRIFKMPDDFEKKELLRKEIRARIIINKFAEAEADKDSGYGTDDAGAEAEAEASHEPAEKNGHDSGASGKAAAHK